MSERTIQCIAVHAIKAGGQYYEPGARLSLPASEAQRCAEAGAVSIGDSADAPSAEGAARPSSEPPSLHEEIVQAIGMLDPENEDDFTKAGKPDVSALEVTLGKGITAEQRDAAWAAFQEAREG